MHNDEQGRYPIVKKAAMLYGAFGAMTVLGMFVWEPLLIPAMISWPYRFLLSIQRLVPDPVGTKAWLFGLGLGFVLVGATADGMQRVAGKRVSHVGLEWGLALVAIAFPLGAITLGSMALASVLGWPMGE
jgi:hypothetical protein